MEDQVLAEGAQGRFADNAVSAPCRVAGDGASRTWRALYRSFENDRCGRFFIDKSFNIILANGRARRMVRSRDILLGGRALEFSHKPAQSALESMVADARRDGGDRWHHKVAAIGDGMWTSLHARCIDDDSGDVEVLVRFVEPSQGEGAMVAVVEAFALTSMEAKVLVGLVSSLPPKVIASKNRISVHTVRTHIRNIYAKLGTHGSSATVSLALQLSSWGDAGAGR